MTSNPEPETQIRAIQPGEEPKLPCWLWANRGWGLGFWWRCEVAADYEYDRKELLESPATHWHPDQPEAPTLAPALHVIREEQKQQQKGGSGTPKTDQVMKFCFGNDTEFVKADFARELEQEIVQLQKQIENQASIIRESCLPANEREARLLGELAKAKFHAKAEAAWWPECASFVKADPAFKEGESISGQALSFLQERKRLREALAYAVERLSTVTPAQPDMVTFSASTLEKNQYAILKAVKALKPLCVSQ